MHYAKSKTASKKAVKPRKRQHLPPTPWRFREARLSGGLGTLACADLLQVSERTIRNWEAGAVRIPYAAYRLLRVLRNGKVLGPDWRGFRVWHDTLVTPEGHRFHFSELAWWSLLVRQAREYQRIRRNLRAVAPNGAPATVGATASDMQPGSSSEQQGRSSCVRPAGLVASVVSIPGPVTDAAEIDSGGLMQASRLRSKIPLLLGDRGQSLPLSLTLPVRPKKPPRPASKPRKSAQAVRS
jgi:DNA-binding transcriptional regulator YiaG